MADSAGQGTTGGSWSAASGAPPVDAEAARQRLAVQIAERVYRLMLTEARLSRARGQQLRRQLKVRP